MPTDKQNAEFMYSMLKQLEVKFIDWKIIAEEHDIKTGHAARMRWCRYRDAREGSKPIPRKKNNKNNSSNGGGSSSADDGDPKPRGGGRAAEDKGRGGKRRKRATKTPDASDDDDEEFPVKKKEESGTEDDETGRPKKRKANVKEAVKEELEWNNDSDVPIMQMKRMMPKTETKADKVKNKPEVENAKNEPKGDRTLYEIPTVKVERQT